MAIYTSMRMYELKTDSRTFVAALGSSLVCSTRKFPLLKDVQMDNGIWKLTDDSKLNGAVGCGILSESVGLAQSIRLPYHCS